MGEPRHAIREESAARRERAAGAGLAGAAIAAIAAIAGPALIVAPANRAAAKLNARVVGQVTFGARGPLAVPGNTAAQFNGQGGVTSPLNLAGAPGLTMEGWVNFSSSQNNVNGVDHYNTLFGRTYVADLFWRTGWQFPGSTSTSHPAYFAELDLWTKPGGAYQVLSMGWFPPTAPVVGWHHLAVTFDGTSGVIYFDGKAVASQAAPAPGPIATLRPGEVCIGWNGSGDPQHGDFAEGQVAFYARALPAARIAAHYAAGRSTASGLYEGTVLSDKPAAYYPLTDAPGSTMVANL